MRDDADTATKGLEKEGAALAVRAFKKSLRNVEAAAKELAPVGHYGRSRGKAGRTGGDLRRSLRVEYLGRSGEEVRARLSSELPYAEPQHNKAFHHPGLYTGAPGDKYAAKFFERAVQMVFGTGASGAGGAGGRDPLGKYQGPSPATFKELLEEEE